MILVIHESSVQHYRVSHPLSENDETIEFRWKTFAYIQVPSQIWKSSAKEFFITCSKQVYVSVHAAIFSSIIADVTMFIQILPVGLHMHMN